MNARLGCWLSIAAGIAACDVPPEPAPAPAKAPSESPVLAAQPALAARPALAAQPAPRGLPPIVILAGGDVNLGRGVGQRILREPEFDPFVGLWPLLRQADLVFANLESPLSDQNGTTQDPLRPLVFTGPPRGAELLARAPFHVVSLANNHVWDYGRAGFLETLDALEAARVAYVGASREPNERHRPRVLSVKGWSIALFAATHVWNPGDFAGHEAEPHVAWAEHAELLSEIRRARAAHDVVLVSYHGGREYSDRPAVEPLAFARAVMDAGADALLGHHPHVPQGIAWFGDRPVFYSLGNLVFGKHREHAWTARGFLARLKLSSEHGIEAAVCPYQIERELPRAAADAAWPGWEIVFQRYVRRTSAFASTAGTLAGPADGQGCLPLRPGTSDRQPALARELGHGLVERQVAAR